MANVWTDDQLEAIKSTDKSTIVSAAAGSGKTAVLVERTIRMLSDETLGIEADRLLAVTFTNDAANNMKDKLSVAMSKLLEKNPQNRWVTKQKDLLSLATICTIDSFCMDLVKNNINELEISGNFSIIDDQENKLMTENAFNEASRFYFENCPDKMKILMDNFAEENDSEVINCATELLRFKGSLPFPDMWKKQCEKNFGKILEREYIDNYIENIEPYMNAIQNGAEYFEKVYNDSEISEYMLFSDALKELYIAAEDRFTNNQNFFDLPDFKNFYNIKLPGKPRKCSDEEKEAYERIKKAQKEITKAVKELEKARIISIEKLKSDKKESVMIFTCLWDFVKKAEEILWEQKLERNKFYFSDITKLTIKLLAEETEDGFRKTELAEKITDEKRYKMILIDEFQDVNNLQSVIFKCISDTDDLRVLGKNVFVVGDMKQSIYRFRQSNPDIFDEARILAKKVENSDKCKAVFLKKNFRSRKNILDFTNFVFENVMSKEMGEVEYNADERLELGACYPEPDFDTDIIFYDKTSGNDDDEDSDGEENDKVNIDKEALIIAQKVKKMIEDKTLVYENGESRPCRAGDFCVLMRTGKLVNDYIKAFERVDICAVGDSVKGYLGAREISLALSMLRIVDNPMNDIPFVAVCLSPIFGFTTDEIAKIRQIDKTKKFYSLFLGIIRDENAEEYGFERIETDDEKIIDKCKKAVEMIAKLRFYASGMSLGKLVQKVYDQTDLMAIASSFENSQQKRANLRMLIRYASKYESSTGGSLSDFLRYLDNVSKSGNDFDEALTVSAGENTVSIKTIHKSKGLEYPFVIVGDMCREYNIPKRSEKIVLNEKTGYGITLRNANEKVNFTTSLYDHSFNQNSLEQKSEELRILYVALTRAKEKLILPLCLKSKGRSRIKKLIQNTQQKNELTASDIGGLLSYAEIIFAALLVHPEKSRVGEYLGVEVNNFLLQKTIPNINFETEKDYDLSNHEEFKEFIPAKVDNTLVSKIVESIKHDENDDNTQTLAKLSVTEFVREVEDGNAEKEITYFPPVPDIHKDKHTVTAAEKGTYTHLFMELCDFEKTENDISSELQRLKDSNMMTEIQAKNVDISAVSSFFESEIFKLCKNCEKIHREMDFKVKLSDMKLDNTPLSVYNNKDVMVQGIADLIVENKDYISIVDYKTDNVKEAGELIDRHFVQLLLYKKAFELIFEKPVKDCYIYSFKLRKSIKIDFESLQNINKNP